MTTVHKRVTPSNLPKPTRPPPAANPRPLPARFEIPIHYRGPQVSLGLSSKGWPLGSVEMSRARMHYQGADGRTLAVGRRMRSLFHPEGELEIQDGDGARVGKLRRRLSPFRRGREMELVGAQGQVVGRARGTASGMTVDVDGVRVARMQLFRSGRRPVWRVACDHPDRLDSRLLVMLAAVLTPDDSTLHTLFEEEAEGKRPAQGAKGSIPGGG